MKLDRRATLIGAPLAALALGGAWCVLGADEGPTPQPWESRASESRALAARATTTAGATPGPRRPTAPRAEEPVAGRFEEPSASTPAAALAPATPSAPASAQGDEALASSLERVDWRASVRYIVGEIHESRRTGRRPSADAALEFAKLDVALGQTAKTLGLAGPTAALADPRVRAAIVPGWLAGLGVEFGAAQTERLVARCRSAPPADAGDAGPLEAAEAALRGRLALEEAVVAVLEPRQLATYDASVVDDPLLRVDAARVAVTGRSPRGLVQGVVAQWSQAFGLGEREQAAARTIAARYAQATLGLPPIDPRLEPSARRVASMQRALRQLQLQRDAERALATSGALDPESRARAERGSARCFQLGLAPR